MSSSTANSKTVAWVVVPALLLSTGWLLRSLERPLAAPAPLRAEQWLALSGHGGLPAMLGGLRSVVAGGFWLRANLAWERRDAAATTALIELTVAADDRSAYFWLNGARMLAYDVPSWLPVDAPAATRQQANERAAQQALRLLDQGLRWRGSDADLFIEIANVHLRRRGDIEDAARYYRLAAEQPGAPWFAARIHAELLRQLGRPKEALAWLREVLPTLPSDDPSAQRAIVEARIRALERELAGR